MYYGRYTKKKCPFGTRLDIWRRPSSVMILGDMRGFGVDVKAFLTLPSFLAGCYAKHFGPKGFGYGQGAGALAHTQ